MEGEVRAAVLDTTSAATVASVASATSSKFRILGVNKMPLCLRDRDLLPRLKIVRVSQIGDCVVSQTVLVLEGFLLRL